MALDRKGVPHAQYDITGVDQNAGVIDFGRSDAKTGQMEPGEYSVAVRFEDDDNVLAVLVGRIRVAMGAGAGREDTICASQPPGLTRIVFAGASIIQVVLAPASLRGLSFLTGAGLPSIQLGSEGQAYIDSPNVVLYGPKTGDGRGAGVVLSGPAGPRGMSLLNGLVPPSAGEGADGDFWIDTATWEISGPKAGGAWPASVSMIGPAPTTQELTDLIAPIAHASAIGAFQPEILDEGAQWRCLTASIWAGVVYQWTRNGVDIPGETASTKPKVATDYGTVIGCKATPAAWASTTVPGNFPPMVAGGPFLDSRRMFLPTGQTAALTNSQNFLRFKIAQWVPHGGGSAPKMVLPWFYATGGNIVPMGNDGTVNWISAFKDGVYYPGYVNGSLVGPVDPAVPGQVPAPITAATGFLTVEFPGLGGAGGELFHIAAELTVPVGGRYPQGYYFVLGGQDMGESRETSGAAVPSQRTTGAIPFPSTPSNASSWGPAFTVWHGWDGVTPGYLITGDSLADGQADIVAHLSDRGCLGPQEKGLDSTAGGRVHSGKLCVRGGKLATLATNTNMLWTMLSSFGVRLFDGIVDGLEGVNDLNQGTVTTLAELKALQLAYWASLRARAPDAQIYHTFGTHWTTDTSGNLYTTVANQTPVPWAAEPGGLLFQKYAWLASGTDIPDCVTLVDIRPGAAVAGAPDRWPVPSPTISGTLVGSVASGRIFTVNLSERPQIGDNLVLSVGSVVAPLPLALDISRVQDTATPGQYILTTVAGLTGGTRPNGTIVQVSFIRDGVHPGSRITRAQGDVIAAAKVGGVIPNHA